ncbi:MAG: acylphosphatase [Pseudomonadota bacterium]
MARIHGRVQGVGYRYWTRTQAESLNLRGYVRNLTDGTVEALLIGEPADVARMLTFCEDGPPTAEVAKVETSKPGPAHRLDMDRFRRAPTRKPGEPV